MSVCTEQCWEYARSYEDRFDCKNTLEVQNVERMLERELEFIAEMGLYIIKCT